MDNNEDTYYKILLNNHNNLANDIVETYYTKHFQDQILTYFRIFFLYYLITTYVYKPELNISQIKQIFFKWLKTTLKNKNSEKIINNFYHHYYYLFKIFFVEKNIYFHVYFNNLVKYFLPLPFELNVFSPIITFRTNVKTFYKKNNNDYLDKQNNYDLDKSYFSNYNSGEIDIHIPMEFFNFKFFSNMDIIYLVAKSDSLYICDHNKNGLYMRAIDVLNFKDNIKNSNKSFEEIFPIWKKINQVVNFDDANYISVLKKFNNRDLFNVFGKYELSTEKYKYLFHNTQNTNVTMESTDFFEKSKFFYLIPSSKSKYFKNESKRICVIFKIDKNINNLLDLSTSIITNNNFTSHMIKKDKENKKWISYDPIKSLNYYKNGNINTKFDSNFKCITTIDSNINNRSYCDVFNYAGRRKLQEIIHKTRKFKYKKIYLKIDIGDIINLDHNYYEKYRIYHPDNVPIYETWDFDKYVLDILDLNGFFSVDFGDAIYGGEIFLTNPKKFIHMVAKSDKQCYKKDAFTNNKIINDK
jgi:hypothetical protein